jgi:hypothetical protein
MDVYQKDRSIGTVRKASRIQPSPKTNQNKKEGKQHVSHGGVGIRTVE